uniref:FGGY carbohydrate kinase domain-containing protein-like n=1 Tax=Rhizophora mucronata TaxID=61149 RepID=A0A2P2M1J6_RHIMU
MSTTVAHAASTRRAVFLGVDVGTGSARAGLPHPRDTTHTALLDYTIQKKLKNLESWIYNSEKVKRILNPGFFLALS